MLLLVINVESSAGGDKEDWWTNVSGGETSRLSNCLNYFTPILLPEY